jgi:ribonucleotide reductase beta subunit family protein with ferritin-like domain
MSLWDKINEETISSLEKQKSFEDDTSKRLNNLLEFITNPAVKLYLHTIIMDTKKHADLYQMIIGLNKESLIGKVNRKKMLKELKTHIENEEAMMKKVKEIRDSIKDDNIKKIISSIQRDERRHHKMLQDISNTIIKEGEDWNRYFYEAMKDYP